MIFNNQEQLARFAIEYFLKNHQQPIINSDQVDKKLKEKKSCFVTLYLQNELRGCIGDYIAYEPLYQNIVKNAIRAAFYDPRFLPISEKELPNLKIEVSVLSPLTEYRYKSIKELLDFLAKEKPGILIEKNGHRALFLPQVWQTLKNPDEFLSNLCYKAGLPFLAWKEGGMKIWTFSVIKENTNATTVDKQAK
ncbi:MAG: AmmeMemoRadiSam system protein A [Microgenomates group bacterium]|nr:AmmeMemoRadiSam system protein A [Microgenomates group bacterium]